MNKRECAFLNFLPIYYSNIHVQEYTIMFSKDKRSLSKHYSQLFIMTGVHRAQPKQGSSFPPPENRKISLSGNGNCAPLMFEASSIPTEKLSIKPLPNNKKKNKVCSTSSLPKKNVLLCYLPFCLLFCQSQCWLKFDFCQLHRRVVQDIENAHFVFIKYIRNNSD